MGYRFLLKINWVSSSVTVEEACVWLLITRKNTSAVFFARRDMGLFLTVGLRLEAWGTGVEGSRTEAVTCSDARRIHRFNTAVIHDRGCQKFNA